MRTGMLSALTLAILLSAGCGGAPEKKAQTRIEKGFVEVAFTSDHRKLDIRDFVADGTRAVAVATNQGLFVEANGAFRKADLPGAAGEVTCVFRDRMNKIYAGTPDGLYESSTGAGAYMRHDAGDVTCLLDDATGRIWVGTKTGLKMLRGNELTVHNRGNSQIPHDEVTCLARDAEGTLYAGTVQGVAKVNPKDGSIAAYTGTVYVPLMTGGVSVQPGNTGMEGNTISRIVALSGGEFFVGTNRGLTRTAGFSSFKHYSADSKEPAKMADGSIGYEDRKGNSPLLSNFIRALAALPDGRVAVGTKTGVSILEPKSDAWETLKKGDEGFPATPVNALAPCPGGFLMGTGAGLFRYEVKEVTE